jgi:hypothetical protein
MFALNRLFHFIDSLKKVIGIGDPDLQHGRIGREAAEKKGLEKVEGTDLRHHDRQTVDDLNKAAALPMDSQLSTAPDHRN